MNPLWIILALACVQVNIVGVWLFAVDVSLASMGVLHSPPNAQNPLNVPWEEGAGSCGRRGPVSPTKTSRNSFCGFCGFCGSRVIPGDRGDHSFPTISTYTPLACGPQEAPDAEHARVYRKVAPAVAAVIRDPRLGAGGSGVFIRKDGILLTSPSACGAAGQDALVLVPGQRLYLGRVIGRVNERELVLVKIDADDVPVVEQGNSEAAQVGQLSYVLGDSYGSIVEDDQPALSAGVVSGIYTVRRKKQRGVFYTGKVIETSAAVNPNQNGGPLVDREGRLLGIVTLNYEESRFTGIAVPLNEMKADIDRLLKEYDAAPPPEDEAWIGLDVRETEEGLEVTHVAVKGPSEKAGLRKGDVIVAADGTAVTPLPQALLERAVRTKLPGETVTLKVRRGEETKDVVVTLGRRPLY